MVKMRYGKVLSVAGPLQPQRYGYCGETLNAGGGTNFSGFWAGSGGVQDSSAGSQKNAYFCLRRKIIGTFKNNGCFLKLYGWKQLKV
jgi:hypothetical protein